MLRARTTHFIPRVVFRAGLAGSLADNLAQAGAELVTAGLASGMGTGLTALRTVVLLHRKEQILVFSSCEKEVDAL